MDLRALKDKAVRLTAAGKLRKAVVLWELLCTHDPQPQHLVRCADVRRRLDDPARAVALYIDASRRWANAGFYARAQAALTVAAQIAPSAGQLALVRKELEKLGPGHSASADEEVLVWSSISATGRPKDSVRSVSIELQILDVPLSPAADVDSPPAGAPTVLRLTASSVAFPHPSGGWLVFSSEAPIEVRRVETLPSAMDVSADDPS